MLPPPKAEITIKPFIEFEEYCQSLNANLKKINNQLTEKMCNVLFRHAKQISPLLHSSLLLGDSNLHEYGKSFPGKCKQMLGLNK